MLEIIINAVFSIISSIGDIILTPITSFLTALIPSFSDFYNSVISFITSSFTYLSFFLKLLCIPLSCVQVVVLVATTTLTITLGIRTYQLIMKCYNYFKP